MARVESHSSWIGHFVMSDETPAPRAETNIEAAPPSGLLGILGGLPIFEALHYREYRLIWFGQIFASLATWMDQVARGWLLYELTNSTLQLGLVRGVQAIRYFSRPSPAAPRSLLARIKFCRADRRRPALRDRHFDLRRAH
jgi:hypothetical protein